MRYLILCLAVLLCIAPVSAGLLDFLNGPTTGIDWDKTTIENHLKTIPADDISTRQERTSQGIAAKVKKDLPISVSVTKKNPLAVNLSPLGDYYIRIDKAEYEPSTGTIKTYLYATRNGRELDIRNPVRFYGMGYTYTPDPGAVNIRTDQKDEKGDYIWKAFEEENPRLALVSSVYSFLQTRDYGKVINDGNDPTLALYPEFDGSFYHSYPDGMAFVYYTTNQTGHGIITSSLSSYTQGHNTRIYNWTVLYRGSLQFNLTSIGYNITVSNANLYIYIRNSSTYQSTYYYSSYGARLWSAWGHSDTSISATDFDCRYGSNWIASNTTMTNVTGLSSLFEISNPNTVINDRRYGKRLIFQLRAYPDDLTPNRWSYGKIQGLIADSSAAAGTSTDPLLVITYTVTDICPATTTCPSATTTPVCTSPAAEPGGMPVTLMYLMIPLALGLSLFSVWHYDNRVYANIVLGGIASAILWFFLAANVITGNIFLCSANTRCILSDVPLFWLFVLFGVIMTVYTLALSVEAIRERNIKDIGGEE